MDPDDEYKHDPDCIERRRRWVRVLVDRGDRRTQDEWARELGVCRRTVCRDLMRLRKEKACGEGNEVPG